ncbi:hypothetical protein F2Q70_00029551 [Brassica cretica]|uniref:Arabidopsis retrotransposon Orf1 C-terminal domain-containing protein n=1 Tax=Brassica cretica TaxID=69181 RepID=A0A8S9FIV2_BRACR|nr:hypothetical protein F2Q70_00029551 [Brassica cretica]
MPEENRRMTPSPQLTRGHERRGPRSPSQTHTSLPLRRNDGIRKPRVLGIADLCHITHPLYPDLVRQVLATAELTFKRSGFPIFKEASFTFYASGVKYSISLEKLTEIYEISEEYTKTSFPRKFPPEQAFWKFIASGDFKSRSASQSLIHNLVLRIAAKVLRNLLFSKDKTSKVTRGELRMLFSGVEDEIKSTDIGIPTSEMKTSPGCVVVQMFVDKKARVIKGSLKKDRSGSLLPPLFRHLELDLSPYQCNETMQFIDVPYLINCQILRDEATYSFIGKDGNYLYCKLPQPDITSLGDVVNIFFIPEPQYLCANPKSSYQDDTMDEPEFVGTVGGDIAYDLGPLDDDADDAIYHRWMVDSQCKNNSLELHWMRDRPDGGKEEKKSVSWSLSRRTVDWSSLSACSSGIDKKGSFQIFRDLP